MAKERLNLLLDRSAIDRGKRYGQLHGTSVSQLVGDFLSKLPLPGEPGGDDLTPTVRRLLGVASGEADHDDYHRYLLEKYGR